MLNNPVGLMTTQRTIIDPIDIGDARFLIELLNSPTWIRYIGDKSVRDESAARQFIEQRFISSYESFGYGYYLVRAQLDNRPMGICGFTNREEYENPDFGFAFLPEFNGAGFALESAVAVMRYGQQVFDFQVLDAGTLADNYPAAKLLAKLGFKALGKMGNKSGQSELVLHRWWRDDGQR